MTYKLGLTAARAIHAQAHLEAWYSALGWVVLRAIVEAEIPHVHMVWQPNVTYTLEQNNGYTANRDNHYTALRLTWSSEKVREQ